MDLSYKNLIVWQKAMNLVVAVYALTGLFPKSEIYGLVSQMRRASVSIPSNIAEGKLRGSIKEHRQFFLIALGSSGELETQISIAKRLPETAGIDYATAEDLLREVMSMLRALISRPVS